MTDTPESRTQPVADHQASTNDIILTTVQLREVDFTAASKGSFFQREVDATASTKKISQVAAVAQTSAV